MTSLRLSQTLHGDAIEQNPSKTELEVKPHLQPQAPRGDATLQTSSKFTPRRKLLIALLQLQLNDTAPRRVIGQLQTSAQQAPTLRARSQVLKEVETEEENPITQPVPKPRNSSMNPRGELAHRSSATYPTPVPRRRVSVSRGEVIKSQQFVVSCNLHEEKHFTRRVPYRKRHTDAQQKKAQKIRTIGSLVLHLLQPVLSSRQLMKPYPVSPMF